MTTWLSDNRGNRCSVECFGSEEAANSSQGGRHEVARRNAHLFQPEAGGKSVSGIPGEKPAEINWNKQRPTYADYLARCAALGTRSNRYNHNYNLGDVLRWKRELGHTDCETFKRVAGEFASGLNASVGGALWALPQWIAAWRKGKQIWESSATQERREAVIADLEAVSDGTFGKKTEAA